MCALTNLSYTFSTKVGLNVAINSFAGVTNEIIDATVEKRKIDGKKYFAAIGKGVLSSLYSTYISDFTSGAGDLASAIVDTTVTTQTSAVETVVDNVIQGKPDKKKKNTNIFKKVGNTVKSKIENTGSSTISAAGAGMAFLLGKQVIDTIKGAFKRFWGW